MFTRAAVFFLGGPWSQPWEKLVFWVLPEPRLGGAYGRERKSLALPECGSGPASPFFLPGLF